MKIEFTLNGRPISVDAPADISLLHLLRDHVGLTGTKEGCGVGECGACSVLLDGRLVNSCLVLAPQAGGRKVVTIEGIRGADGGPNDLQQNFIDKGAVQCGYCIPGMVLAGEQAYPVQSRLSRSRRKTLEPEAQTGLVERQSLGRVGRTGLQGRLRSLRRDGAVHHEPGRRCPAFRRG